MIEDEYESPLDCIVNFISQSPIKNEVDNYEEGNGLCSDSRKNASFLDNLSSHLFERYRKFLRNTYNDPVKRISHEWSARDKKSLHLDWIYNVKNYDEWIPPTFDDFRYQFFSNIPFSLHHVLQSTIQYTATHIKIIPAAKDEWLHLLVIHDVKIDGSARSMAKIVLVNMNCMNNEVVTHDSIQIRCDGLTTNATTNKLNSPSIIFDGLVESIDICKYDSDQDSYLLAVKLRSQDISLYNLKDFIRKSTQSLLYNDALTQFSSASRILPLSYPHTTFILPVKFIFSCLNDILYPSHIAAIISGSQHIAIYPINRVSDLEFKLVYSGAIMIYPRIDHYFTDLSPTICLEGAHIILYTVDTSSSLNMYQVSKASSVRLALSLNVPEILDPLTLGNHYFHALKLDVNLRFPNLIAVGGARENIWVYDILKAMSVNPAQNRKRGNNEDRLAKIAVFQTIIRPYLPKQVYRHYGPIHPVVSLKWVRGAEALLAVQYGKFIKIAEGNHIDQPNHHSVWAIWNVSRNVLSTDDAIMRNKHWIGKTNPPTYSEINRSRLVAIYSGHFESRSGVVASDVVWSCQFGLVGASSDVDRQVHVVKPGIWSWGDCDDEFALARLSNDARFFKNALRHIRNISTGGSSDDSGMENPNRHRRVSGRFLDLEMGVEEELKKMTNGIKFPLRLKSLPEWYRKQIVLSTDIDKLVERLVHG